MNAEAERIEQLTLELVGPLTEEDRSILLGRRSGTREVASDLAMCLPLPDPPPLSEDVTLHYGEDGEVYPNRRRWGERAIKVLKTNPKKKK